MADVDAKNTKKNMIFIIEDDEVLLRALYILFHAEEYTVATATDGEMAVKMAQRIKPDIVLLDILLPRLSGFEVLKNLKSNPDLKNIPVIVLSNLDNGTDIEKAKELGVVDYFVKSSTNLEILANKVKELLTQKNES